MKKLVSIFLSLVLVAVSVTCSLVLATANNGEQQSLGLAANWRLYENKTATIGETGTPAGSWAKVTDNTDAKYLHNGTSSVKFSCISQRGATEFSVKKNTDYELSFLYYNESLNAAGTYALSQVAVVLPNGSVAKKDALAFMDGGSGTGTTKTGEWQRIALSFHSGENTTLALTILFAVSPVYIDDFYLVDLSSNNPNKAENWTLYENSSKKVGAEGKLAGSWATVSQNSNAKFTHNGAASLKFSCISQRGAVTLPVEQNKNYELSFWAFSEKLNAAGTYFLSQATVLVPEGEVDPEGKDCLGSANAQGLTKTVNTWVKITVPFNSGSNSAVVFSLLFGSSPVYVSEISLAERSAEPQVNGVVNFEQTDKETMYYDQAERYELQKTTGPAGETTTALHIKQGSYATPTNLNWGNVLKDSDPIYSFAVTPGETYKMSCWFKVAENAEIEYLTLMYSHNGNRSIFADLTKTTEKGKWVKYSYIFTAAAGQTKCSFQLNAGKATPECWLDDLSVLKNETHPTPTEPSEWSIYDWDTETIGTSGKPGPSWAKISTETSGAHDSNGDKNSVYLYTQASKAVKRIMVKKNTDYCLYFKYFVNNLNAAGTYSLSQAGITTPNGGIVANKDGFYSFLGNGLAYVANNGLIENKEAYDATAASTVTGTWQEVKLPFNSGNNEQLALVVVSAVGQMWLDELTLKEEKITLPQKDYGTPKDLWTIDFEDVTKEYSRSKGINVVEVVGYKGQNTKALHTIAGDYGSALFLNYHTTTTDTDPIYTIPVLPKRVYELSWRVKIKENSGDINWLSFYQYYNGKYANIANLQKAKQGEWLYYKVLLVTEEKQNRFSFTFNAGRPAPEIWVDDINLALTSYQAFEGYNGPQDKVLINFDDYAIALSNPATEIVPAPAYNGQVSNALHSVPGDYSNAQTLNPGTTTTYRDPVFTIPVKENTLYRFSLRAYLQSKTTNKVYLPYCAVHIDYKTSNIMHLENTISGVNNQWINFEKQFCTAAGQTQISIFINFANNLKDLYLDDICLEEMKPGVVANTALSYCENPFDLLQKNSAAMAAITSGKSSVTQLQLEPSTLYTFGATVQGYNAEVYLSTNGSDPLNSSSATQSYTGRIVASGTKTRTGYQFVSPIDGKVYLVLKNNSSLTLQNVQLFKTKSLSGSAKDIGKENDPNIAPEQIGEVTELVAIGSVAEQNLYNNQTPATGDTGILPAAIILVLTAGIGTVLFATGKKGGKHHA